MVKVNSTCKLFAPSAQVTKSSGTKHTGYISNVVQCPKTKNVPLTIYFFADKITKEIGEKSPTFHTLDGKPFKFHEISLSNIATYIRRIYRKNGFTVFAKPLDEVKGEKEYRYWQENAFKNRTEACAKIFGNGDKGGNPGEYYERDGKPSMEVNFQRVMIPGITSDGLSNVMGNVRYDYDYFIAYVICHEMIHWQLEMMNDFYRKPKDFWIAFNLEQENGGHDHSFEHNYTDEKGESGPHLNTPSAAYYMESYIADRMLPEQKCGIKMFLEDYKNGISDAQKPAHWRKISDILIAMRAQRSAKTKK